MSKVEIMSGKIIIRKFGGPEVMEWVEDPIPEPGAGEVLIRQTAVGLNFIDVYHREGLYPMELPFTPGSEAAGVIEALGDVRDKRILLIDGEPVPYALARIPAAGESRGNLAAGGSGEGRALSERDRWICNEVGRTLQERGLMFVGLDVIGEYLTEINVTSPTCIRELDRIFDIDIGAQLMDAIAARVAADGCR